MRENGDLDLMSALSKMTIMPAQRLQGRAPAFLNKGRIKQGADADIVLFDPLTVKDQSTYTDPIKPPIGLNHVIVNGVPVVSNSKLEEGALPGKGIRAKIR